MMDALVAIVPLGRTPPWTAAVLELTRQEITSDPAWANGSYSQAPENGMRLWARTMALITRTPELLKYDLPNSSDAAGWLQTLSDDAWRKVDARNWVYQSWAYETHDVGATPGFDGDYLKALRAIRARTLILAGTKDLLNPESEAAELANNIPNARFVSIQPRMPVGHFAAAGKTPPEVDLQNTVIGLFLSQDIARPLKPSILP
jgi:homoserine O-acetyltransferase